MRSDIVYSGRGQRTAVGPPCSVKISVEDLAGLLDRPDTGLLVLDVREPAELELCMLPGAVNVPLGELHLRLEEITIKLEELARIAEPCENGLHMVTVCASGNRSATAAELLSRQGWRVADLDGGMNAWQSFQCARRD